MQGMSIRHMSPAIYSLMQKRTRLELDNYPETAKRWVTHSETMPRLVALASYLIGACVLCAEWLVAAGSHEV